MQPGIRSVNRLAANLAITTNTVLQTLGLAVPISAKARLHLRWWIPFTEAGAVAGAKSEVLVPAAGVLYTLSFFYYNLVATHLAIDNAGLQVAAATFSATGAEAGNYLLLAEMDIVNGVNAGNVDLQVSQAVSDAGALTFLAGCFVESTIF